MGQDSVYHILARRQGQFVSGQTLSRLLGVSRAAVWKAVESLRQQGCAIEARSGRGYRLIDSGDRLNRRAVAACLCRPRDRWHVLDEIDSTNTQCRRLAADGAPDGTVVMANRQTAGRGRQGRSFLSPAGSGLYLSVLWRPEGTPEALLPLTALAAVAVCRAITRLSGTAPQIKWPNDIVLDRRKLGGILTELSVEGESGRVEYVIVGIGVNCRQREEDFPPELREVAASLDMALPVFVPRASLAAALIEELDVLRTGILPEPHRWLEDYRRACLTVGQPVRLLRGDTVEEALAEAVDDRFGLAVRFPDGTAQVLRAGEVSVRGLYGYL